MAGPTDAGAPPVNPFAGVPDPFAQAAPAPGSGQAAPDAAPVNPFAGVPDPFDPQATAAAAPVTPQGNSDIDQGPQPIFRGGVPTGTTSTASDVTRTAMDTGLGMAQDAVGFGQMLTGPGGNSAGSIRGLTPQQRAAAVPFNAKASADIQKITQPVNTELAKLQIPLAQAQQYNQSLMSPQGKAILNAPLNPMLPNNVFTYPAGQVAAVRGAQIITNLASFLLPGSLLGKAIKAAKLADAGTSAGMALTLSAQGAGQTMAAVSQVVNSSSDGYLRSTVPAYAADRRAGVPPDAAKARLIDAQGTFAGLANGAVSAAVGELTGERLGSVFKNNPMAGNVFKRVATEGATQGAVNAAMGAAGSVAQQKATGKITGQKFSWGQVAQQAGEGFLSGATLGSLFGLAQKHVPEMLTETEKSASPNPAAADTAEGQAVNHATHPDIGTAPGVTPDEDEPIDYDQGHGDDEDSETEEAEPTSSPSQPAAEAGTPAPVGPSNPAEAENKPQDQSAAAVGPGIVEAQTKTTLPASKPYVTPDDEQARVPVAPPVRVTLATKKITETAAKLIASDPNIPKADTGLVSTIMDDLIKQARDEMPYHEGSVPDMMRQFAETKPLRDRINDAVAAARQDRAARMDTPEPEPDNTPYPPAAIDPEEQTRARDGSLFKPGNEGALLGRINQDEDNRATYSRAEKMVAERGDDAHPIYHDILAMKGRRGGDVRTRALQMDRARAVEKNYLRAEAERNKGKTPPAEGELLRQDMPGPLADESNAAFWARMEKAYKAGEDNGTFMKRGSYLYRAKKALDEAREKANDPEAIPDRATTQQMRGEEFVARHADFKLDDDADKADEEDTENKDDDTDSDEGYDELDGKPKFNDEDDEDSPDDLRAGMFGNFTSGEPHTPYGMSRADNKPARYNDESVANTIRLLDADTLHTTTLSDVMKQIMAMKDDGTPRMAVVKTVAEAISKLGLKVPVIVGKIPREGRSNFLGRPGTKGAFTAGTTNATPHGMIGVNLLEHKSNADILTTVLHEAVHAATYWGLRHDPAFYKRVDQLAGHVRETLIKTKRLGPKWDYATTNPDEFLAHALSDEAFMQELKNIQVPDRYRIAAGSRLRDAFSTLVASIRKLLGINQSNDTALASALEAGFQAMKSAPEQDQFQRDFGKQYNKTVQFFSKNLGVKPNVVQDTVTDPSWGDNLAKSINNVLRANNDTMHMLRKGWYAAMTNGHDLAQYGKNFFEWTPNTRFVSKSKDSVSQTFQSAMSHMAHRAQTLLDESTTKVLRPLAAYLAKASPQDAAALADAMHASTMYDYDPSRVPNPKAQPKTAAGMQRLERHREGYAAFKKLNPYAQSLFKKVRDNLRSEREALTRQAMRNTIEQVHINRVREEIAAGQKSALDHQHINDQTQRYMDKQETDADKQEMGKTHEILKRQRAVLSASQNYFPLGRHGKYAVEYHDQRPSEHMFSNEADKESFARSTDLFVTGEHVKHFDANGDEVDKDDPAAQPIVRSEYTVHTQNKGLELFDSAKDAKARREELLNHLTNKYTVMPVEHAKKDMQVARALSGAQVDQLHAALGKTAYGADNKAEARQALNEAIIHLLPPNAVRASSLRRHNVMGASKDIMRTMASQFQGSATLRARLEYAREADNAIEAMRESYEKLRKSDDPDVSRVSHIRQELLAQAEKRRMSSPLDQPTNAKVPQAVRTLQQVAFVKYMATASFNIIQAAQPFMTGMPYIQSRYGYFAAPREMYRVAKIIGGPGVFAEGNKQAGSALYNMIKTSLRDPGDYVSLVANSMMEHARTPEEKALAKSEADVLRRLADEGYVDHGAGVQLQQVLNTSVKNPLAKGLHAAEEAARAIPTAIEVINRAMLGLATHRLELKKSGDPDKAFRAAGDAIQGTQGDYSPANTPLLMQGNRHPFLAPAFTFHKYGQMIYSLLARHFYMALAGQDAETRKIGRRTLMNTMLMHTMTAGLHGLPLGVILLPMAIASFALGEDKPWNFDQHAHEMLMGVFHDAKVVDAVINGLPTLLGLNVAKRMGTDGLVFDQLPGDNKWSSWAGMVGDTIMGAPGEILDTIPQMLSDVHHGNYAKAAEDFLFKSAADPIRAYSEAKHGVTDNYGDTIVAHMPAMQLIWQTIGFEPDAIEEGYAARDAGLAAKDQYKQERAEALDGFSTAYHAGSFAQAQAALQQFNSQVPVGSRISLSQAIKATRSTNRNNKQILGVGFTKKQQFLADPMKDFNIPN